MDHISPHLTDFCVSNFRKLAAYLVGDFKHGFFMGDYKTTLAHAYEVLEAYSEVAPEDVLYRGQCGTVCCALGSGPFAGIAKHPMGDWTSYGFRCFIDSDDDEEYPVLDYEKEYLWLFHDGWIYSDPTPKGAAKRIYWMLENGVPDNYKEQLHGKAPLCYQEMDDDNN